MEPPAVSTGLEPAGTCGRCGFDPEQLLPPDAAVAARSLARRWSELLTRVADSRDASALLTRRLPSGATLVDRAGAVAATMEWHADALRRVWERADVELHPPPPLPPTPSDTASVVRRLRDAGEHLAASIERYESTQWDRTGRRAGETISAFDLARDAVHEASHWLRVCTDEIEPWLPSEGTDDGW